MTTTLAKLTDRLRLALSPYQSSPSEIEACCREYIAERERERTAPTLDQLIPITLELDEPLGWLEEGDAP